MTGFEALFAFYALLLGLAIANVANAFADMYSRRARMPVGWTVPLLGVVVILSASQQWLSLFRAQQGLTLEQGTLLICLAMALPYIVIGRLMVPHGDAARTLEDHYAAHRMLLVGMLLAPVLTSLVVNVVFDLRAGAGATEVMPRYALYYGVRLALILPLLVWPSHRLQRAGLAALGVYTLLMMT